MAELVNMLPLDHQRNDYPHPRLATSFLGFSVEHEIVPVGHAHLVFLFLLLNETHNKIEFHPAKLR